MPSREIVIDLSSSNHNQRVSSGAGLIQREAFETLKAQIIKDLTHADQMASQCKGLARAPDKELYPHGSGLTYFIDGTRGAGKSTFLRFTYDHLHAPVTIEQRAAAQAGAVPVLPLLYLDPSRIESSEIVLLHILKQLKRLAEECAQHGRTREEDQEKLRQRFKDMAGGLHLFVSKSDSLKDLDAELFLDYGLDRAADSQRLRSLLHDTIALVCQMHNTQALLLAIDDADTKFAQAIEVLECIRKYLDTPQMVVLVTGDMEMYSLLVQNHFQQDFATDDSGFTPDRKQQQTRMVAHLEEQYLLKLFPIQRRLQLKTLHTLAERQRRQGNGDDANPHLAYMVRVPGRETTLSLQASLDEIATRGLRLQDRADLAQFREHSLKLPVRSLLQLLSTYFQLTDTGTRTPPESAAEALRATALSSLYQHDVDVESIAEGDLHAVIEAAFDLCQRDGEPDTAIYLRPQSRDASLRNAYVSLAADVARLCEGDPSSAITYMLGLAGSSNVLHLVEGARQNDGSGSGDSDNEEALRRKVKQYLSVGRKDNALNWSWHATAALIGASHSKGLELQQGIVGVRTSRKGNAKTFDGQLNAAIRLAQAQTYPAIAFCQSAVKKPSHTRRYLSIFNTLGLISNLLALDVSSGNDVQGQIRKQLNKIKSVQTVSLPNWNDLTARHEETEDLSFGKDSISPPSDADEHDDAELLDGLAELVAQLESWLLTCRELKRGFHPSALLLGKIWNRLYFSLDNISAAMRASNQSSERCAKTMELFAWALLNACLVEEFDYHPRRDEQPAKEIDRSNPRISGANVIKKFLLPDATPDIAPLTFMIASCPLVLGLIKDDKSKGTGKAQTFIDSLNNKLSRFQHNWTIPNSALCSAEIWAHMAETSISQ